MREQKGLKCSVSWKRVRDRERRLATSSSTWKKLSTASTNHIEWQCVSTRAISLRQDMKFGQKKAIRRRLRSSTTSSDWIGSWHFISTTQKKSSVLTEIDTSISGRG